MKDNLSHLILVVFDVLVVYISIVLAYSLVSWFGPAYNYAPIGDVIRYTDKLVVYILIITSFFTFKIYKFRHDFWEEAYIVLKALAVSLVMLLAVIALNKEMDNYSRTVVVLSFMIMGFLTPIAKYILKVKLEVFGLWEKKAFVISDVSEITHEIFGNKYLGYIQSSKKKSDVIFMDTSGSSKEKIEEKLSKLVHKKKEIIFIPFLRSFNYSNAGIIEIFNSRTNMVILENSLEKPKNILMKKIAEIFLAVLILPFLALIFAIIIFKIKKEEPEGSIFFKQERIGQDGEIFVCYKFRSMKEDGDIVLEKYLQENPEEVENYNIYHKYENDPRITKVGDFLRRTSLDELPQIINVFKGEMSLIGPRPYMLNEKEKIGSNIDVVLAVKPGISGLWQVSGRSNVDFHSRVDIDVYYTRNWNLWLDFVIMVKTVKAVLIRDGAS